MFQKTTFLFIVFLGLTSMFAQVTNNLVFYSSGGEKFQVVLNGVKQNAQAQTNVKVTDLNAEGYEAKVIFQDQSLGEVTKMMMMPETPSEVTIRILKNKKGRYVMRFFGAVPLASAPAPATDQHVVTYSVEQRFEDEPMGQRMESSSSMTTTTTTTTTTNSDEDVPPSSGGFVDINVDGTSIQVGVQVEDDMVDGNISVSTSGSTTTTTTTTTTSSSSSSNYDDYEDFEGDFRDADHASDDHYRMPGYDGKIGCDWPMSSSDFSEAASSIGSKTFEDSKLKMAKQIAQSNCLLAEQVRDIMKLLEYEDSRVEFAKFAYPKTYDQGNYYKVNDAFEYELSIDELDEFIVK